MANSGKIETSSVFDPKMSTYVQELLGAPLANPAPESGLPDGFYPKENAVCYRSSYFVFGDEEGGDAPEEVLLVTRPIKGNYGEILSAGMVAQMVAAALNMHHERYQVERGIRPAPKA